MLSLSTLIVMLVDYRKAICDYRNVNDCEIRSYYFKAEWYLYVPSPSAVSKSAFCVHWFCIIPTVKSDYFLKRR
jgi:hypothetical protein